MHSDLEDGKQLILPHKSFNGFNGKSSLLDVKENVS